VIPIEIAVLIWGLGQTAREGRGYASQVGAGVLMSMIGGLIIVGSSLLFSVVVFPHSTQEVMAMREAMYRAANPPGPATDAILAQARRGASPVTEALQGFVGTVITGLLVSLVVSILARVRKPAESTGTE
jgi:hypothetical protein